MGTAFAIIFLAISAYGLYFLWSLFRHGGIKNHPAFQKAQARQAANFIAAGGKPWGSPLAGQSHGAAYFMNTQQLIDAGLGEPVGGNLINNRLFLGGHNTQTSQGGRVTGSQSADIYAPMEGHVLTVAPTRTGKGTAHIIPNLLNYSGSVVVSDIKSENYFITGRWRADINDKVFRFAPFGKDSACWNPLDFIKDDDDGWENAALMADLLVYPATEISDFWIDIGRNVLRGVILHVVTSKPASKRNMAEVRRLLSQSSGDFAATIEEMMNSENELIRRSGNAFDTADQKVKDNILSTLESRMGIWDSPRLARIMDKSDFSFSDLKEEMISVFFCIPPSRLSSYAPVMRLFFGLALAQLTDTKGDNKMFPVTFFLDEFPQLGRMKIIEDGIAYLAGYGVRLWMFAQDLSQLKSTYGEKAQSIIANSACRIFSGTSDFETAKLVSDMCGQMTIPVVTHNEGKTGDPFNKQTGESMAFMGQPLMSPQEIMAMSVEDDQLIFYQGKNPVQGIKIPYYTNPDFDGMFDEWTGEEDIAPEPISTPEKPMDNQDQIPQAEASEDGDQNPPKF